MFSCKNPTLAAGFEKWDEPVGNNMLARMIFLSGAQVSVAERSTVMNKVYVSHLGT